MQLRQLKRLVQSGIIAVTFAVLALVSPAGAVTLPPGGTPLPTSGSFLYLNTNGVETLWSGPSFSIDQYTTLRDYAEVGLLLHFGSESRSVDWQTGNGT